MRSTLIPVASGSRTCPGLNSPGLNLIHLFHSQFLHARLPSATITGPNGSMSMSLGGNKTTLSQSGAFLSPGDYTVAGSGGKDIGPFTAQITVPVAPTLANPASRNGLTITRAKGMILNHS